MTGELTLTSIQFAFVGQLIAMGMVLWGLWKSVAAAGDKQAPAISLLRGEILAKIDAEVALASKTRHDMANSLQVQLAKIEVEIDRLKRETVRRDELASIEARLTAMFSRVDNKMDLLNDKLVPLLALEKQVQSMDNRLGEALRRIEAVSVALKRDGAD